jgi:hypothetical protein
MPERASLDTPAARSLRPRRALFIPNGPGLTLAPNDLLVEATLPLSLATCNIRSVPGQSADELAPDVVQVIALAQGRDNRQAGLPPG